MKHKFLIGALLTLLLSSIHPFSLSAKTEEDISFKASAPAQVILNKPFQLTFTVNHKASNIQPAAWEHFEVLAGPYTSQSQSTSFVNGQMSSSFSLTYTYTLLPTEEGTFAINPATITVSGDTYRSNGLKITVLPADEPRDPSNSPQRGEQQTSSPSREGQEGSNIFIRTIVNKTNVSEQEAIYLCYKLYFADVDVAQFTNNTKIPEFTGFLKQELENGEIQTELEHFNGRNYQAAVLYKTILYPQHSGDIKIDPASFEAILRVQNRAQIRSIFDDFFGSYTNVARTLTAPGVTIHVRALPSGKPEGFSGAVGTFKLTSHISPSQPIDPSASQPVTSNLKANEAVTIKLDIQGSGNMKLIKTPAIDWPEGFEPYDPKVTNNFKTTTAGVSGTKSIEYLAIPRAAGQYLIPSIRFAYYDTQAKAYKTLSTPEYTVNVQRDGNSSSSASGLVTSSPSGGGLEGATRSTGVLKEDIHHLGSDIRYIHTAEPRPSAQRSFSDSGLSAKRSYSAAVLYGYLLPLVIALLAFLFLRKYAKEHANAAHVRYKKANKVAQKRLRQAERLLKVNDLSHFYEELERALWQYLSDRLRIQTASLNKENIASVLQSKQVNSDLIARVNNVITTTQIARYTSFSAQPAEEAQQLYNQTIELINDLENQKL